MVREVNRDHRRRGVRLEPDEIGQATGDRLTEARDPLALDHRGGVLNVASVAAFMPIPYTAVYGATKAFVLSFSEALWAEYRERGVRVTALHPGATETPFFDRAGEAAAAGSKRVSPEGVVELGLRAFSVGRASAVHGARNGGVTNLGRFFSREFIAKATASLTRPKAPTSLTS